MEQPGGEVGPSVEQLGGGGGPSVEEGQVWGDGTWDVGGTSVDVGER